jgi:hypothetical protein
LFLGIAPALHTFDVMQKVDGSVLSAGDVRLRRSFWFAAQVAIRQRENSFRARATPRQPFLPLRAAAGSR